MKRTVSLLCALALLLSGTAALAESSQDAVSLILNVGTTQAFTDEAVSMDDLQLILQAGLAAASAINQQPWYFVAVTNRELMQEIAGSGMGGAPAGDFAPSEGAPAAVEGFGPSEGAPAAPMASGGAKAGVGDSPAVIIIYRNDASSATTRETLETKTSVIE